MSESRPIVRASGEGDLLRTQVERVVKARGADTAGALSFTVVTSEPGFAGPGLHRHLRNAEAFYILEGTFRFRVADDEHTVEPHGFVFVPPKVAHAFVSADGAGGKMIVMFMPGDFAGYFDEIAEIHARRGTRDEIASVQAKYGMETLGPPIGRDHD
ncbi:MAG: cupin domain-containing protein [Chloroflexi bacterium]|nr:cupin domain-containing protein [Chloroflexota bacterium]